MKKTLLALTLALAGVSAAFAADYGSAGCGVGSLIFKENDASQILAATTNGTFGNQTFGITSGTLGCNNKGLVKTSMAKESYIEANYKDLARDVAQGKGEYVNNLASLYGMTADKTQKFVWALQNDYKNIFSANDAKTALNEINKIAATL